MRLSAFRIILASTALIAAACGSGGEATPTAGAPSSADPIAGSAEDTGGDRSSTGSATSAAGTDSGSESDAGSDATGTGPSIRPLPPADGVPEAEVAAPEPVSIRIPDLGVDGNAVRPVGVEANGDYEVPIASEVGWYKFGSAPGEPGSSVLAGHIAYNGDNGVFVDLSKVELGATVELTLDDGRSLTYEVVELATYVKTELPFDDIFNESGPDRVVLITCGGTFNPALRSYESNVVAYAEPVA